MNNYMDIFNNIQNNNNSNNYLKCNYNPNEDYNQLYDIYEGFIRGNMFKNLYNDYKIKPYNIEPKNEQDELLTYIDMYSFAAHDISLYLDTHPNDYDMIKLYNQLNMEIKNLQIKYQKEYEPININDNQMNSWLWATTKWPWEGNDM